MEPFETRAGLGLWWVVGGGCALFGLLVVGVVGVRGLLFVALTLGPWAAIAWLLRKRWLRVDGTGLTRRGLLATTSLRWDDITHYTMWSKGRGHAAGVGGAVMELAVAAIERRARGNRFLVGAVVLHGPSGTRVAIGPGWRDVETVLDRVFAELHPRLRARTVDVRPFTLGASELEHPEGSIAYDRLERIDLAGGRLVLRLHGQDRPYATLRSERIRNVMLLVTALLDRGVRVRAHDAFVPADAWDALTSSAPHAPALPEARVVS